jgi:hypothetical protein
MNVCPSSPLAECWPVEMCKGRGLPPLFLRRGLVDFWGGELRRGAVHKCCSCVATPLKGVVGRPAVCSRLQLNATEKYYILRNVKAPLNSLIRVALMAKA